MLNIFLLFARIPGISRKVYIYLAFWFAPPVMGMSLFIYGCLNSFITVTSRNLPRNLATFLTQSLFIYVSYRSTRSEVIWHVEWHDCANVLITVAVTRDYGRLAHNTWAVFTVAVQQRFIEWYPKDLYYISTIMKYGKFWGKQRQFGSAN